MNKLTQQMQDWMNIMLLRADSSNDVKTKVDADGKYIRTPDALCFEIVEQIAKSADFTDKKFLVVDTVEFIPVLLTFGVKPCNITYVAPYVFKGQIASALGAIVIQESLLEWKTNMKFDVVIGNPPYQDGKDKTFFQKFVNMSFKLADIVSMIIPATWTAPSGKNKKFFSTVTENIVVYKFLGRTAFPDVELSTCYFISNKADCCEIVINGIRSPAGTNVTYLPSGDSNISLTIIDKMKLQNQCPLIAKIGSLYRKDVQLDHTGIKCIFSAGLSGADYDWDTVSRHHLTNGSIKGYGAHKTIFSGFTQLGKLGTVKYAGPDYACAAQCLFVEVPDENCANNLQKYLTSKIFRVVMQELKGTVKSNSRRMLASLPLVDVNRSWTDNELYSYFNLTQQEINYIEETIK